MHIHNGFEVQHIEMGENISAHVRLPIEVIFQRTQSRGATAVLALPLFLDGFCFLELVFPGHVELGNQPLSLLKFLDSRDLVICGKRERPSPSTSQL
jgi:hypothetical protein